MTDSSDENSSGKVGWANKIAAGEKQKILKSLRLPADTGPREWLLTEFEDTWPYAVAPECLSFVPDSGHL